MNIEDGKLDWRMTYIYCCLGFLLLAACTLAHGRENEVVSVKTIAHYGGKIGISSIYVNEVWVGSHSGWGGGGSFCCIELSGDRTKPVFVSVKWES